VRTRPQPSIKLGQDLNAFQQIRQENQEEAPAVVAEEATVSEVNSRVELPVARLDAALKEYAARLKSKDRINVASILESGHTSLLHNKWTFAVNSEMFAQLVEREKSELLPFMREKTSVPDLFLEVQVDESRNAPDEGQLYTPEQKLKELARRNPSVRRMQEIFNTRIIY
jgi:hypothetical protein